MITVLAGVNGAGKSSISGVNIRKGGGEYFNPDEIARKLITDDPTLSQFDANSESWKLGFSYLTNAIENDINYTFETTLGGHSITQSLIDAAKKGISIRIFYIGLNSPELHIERVRSRVSKGGHDIPEDKIRDRYTSSTHNLMMLLPYCGEVVVFDNSVPLKENMTSIKKLFIFKNKTLTIETNDMPDWAKPIVVSAKDEMESSSGKSGKCSK